MGQNKRKQKSGCKDNDSNKQMIKYFALIVLSVFCAAYSIFYSTFAKIHTSFRGFPVFIGEILLGVLLLFMLIDWKSGVCREDKIRKREQKTQAARPIKHNYYKYGLIAFLGFIFLKAVLGYFQYGGLAFRNAALFYYSLFFVLAYCFYAADIFRIKFVKEILFFILAVIMLQAKYPVLSFYFFSYYALILILSQKSK
jgi:hypothetical protein